MSKRAPSENPDAEKWRVVGPTVHSGNLLIMRGETCIGTVKFFADRADACRLDAERFARAAVRVAMLKHLAAEMEADDRWHAELEMVREELKATKDEDGT